MPLVETIQALCFITGHHCFLHLEKTSLGGLDNFTLLWLWEDKGTTFIKWGKCFLPSTTAIVLFLEVRCWHIICSRFSGSGHELFEDKPRY